MYTKVREIFDGGQIIVDLGCGSGELLLYVGEKYEQRIGLDMSRQRLGNFDKRPSDWIFQEANLNSRLPFDNETIDAVFCNQVIEHIIDPATFMAEIYRVLRPNGRCALTTPNIRYVKYIISLIFSGYGPRTGGKDNRDGAWDNGHIHYFTHKDLRELFYQTGFSEVDSQALITDPNRNVLRRALSLGAATQMVRNFLSSNILIWAVK